MRIEKIKLKNYRQYRDVELSFKQTSGNDLHIIVGKNGMGKTNLLNAINWCLYKEEPHLSKDSEQLPRLNLKTIENAEEGEKRQVAVELWIQIDNKQRIIFTRKSDYIIHKNSLPSPSSSVFEVKIVDDKGNTNILTEEEAQNKVERFVPHGIRDFFFFDGERLDSYFKEATGQRIRHAIFGISQIDLLNLIEDRLNKVLKDFQKEAGRLSPDIDLLRKNLESTEEGLNEINQRIEECKRQIGEAKEKIAENGEKIRGIPDVGKLQGGREKLRKKVKEIEETHKRKQKEKEGLLFEFGKILMLYPVIKKSLKTIEEKRRNKEIPPTIDKGLIKRILEEDRRCICGKKVDDEAEKNLKQLLSKITLSSEIATELSTMSSPLNEATEKVKDFKSTLKSIQEDVQQYEDRLKELNEQISEIDGQIGGYDSEKDIEKIREWYSELKKFEGIYDDNQQNLGVFKETKKRSERDVEFMRKQYDEELKKEGRFEKLRKRINFTQKALQVLEQSRKYVMDEIKQEIEIETGSLFLDLIWKEETFESVNIDNGYNLHLIHSIGYDSLGSVSSGERELLALSFTIALHKISGFEFSILIDTPVTRLSSEHREKFAEIFSKLSEAKQIILLVLPSEYSDEMREILDRKVSNMCELKLSSDEKEVKMEVR